MSITVNGESRVPPGFRFHPTEEELLDYYLRKKVAGEKVDLDIMKDVDLNRLEPWDIQEKCRIGSGPQNDWYFFSHKDKKYPTGTRTNRATAAGFWKATGRDKAIYGGVKRIGMRKTSFFTAEGPPMAKSQTGSCTNTGSRRAETTVPILLQQVETDTPEEGWVVCRVFKKKSHYRIPESSSSKNTSSVPGAAKTKEIFRSCSEGTLDQIIQFLSRSCKHENEFPIVNPILTDGGYAVTASRGASVESQAKLPPLENPSVISLPFDCPPHVGRSSYLQDSIHVLLSVDQGTTRGQKSTTGRRWTGSSLPTSTGNRAAPSRLPSVSALPSTVCSMAAAAETLRNTTCRT
ncbi:unnamed protein product [Spirodela intermedia]|uniref:NAC domain-containing protein n=1 Tax=Spirodela intermedia TaxID=51605 RepID=A0A7I8J8X6_SPIIN|nr:unnamed protein product [Spirodela intermedia]CAA6666668.1 unnamed protein product [Spirodela intermedia]